MGTHEDQSLRAEVAEEDTSSANRVEGMPGSACWAQKSVLEARGMSYWECRNRVLSAAPGGRQQAVAAAAHAHTQKSFAKRHHDRHLNGCQTSLGMR